ATGGAWSRAPGPGWIIDNLLQSKGFSAGHPRWASSTGHRATIESRPNLAARHRRPDAVAVADPDITGPSDSCLTRTLGRHPTVKPVRLGWLWPIAGRE